MRKILLKIGIVCVASFILLSLLGSYLYPLLEKFGDPRHVENALLFYIMLIGIAALGLFILRSLIGIIIIALIIVILFILFQMDILLLVNLF